METPIESEINSCMMNMKHLQTKYWELQKEKQEQEAKKEIKIQETEPNMAVMESWLRKNNVIMEHDKMAEEAKSKCLALDRCNGCDLISKEEQQYIRQNYSKYRYNSRSKIEIAPNFHNHNQYTGNTPSEFMNDYIEATYNLFKIMQKRIDELEHKNSI